MSELDELKLLLDEADKTNGKLLRLNGTLNKKIFKYEMLLQKVKQSVFDNDKDIKDILDDLIKKSKSYDDLINPRITRTIEEEGLSNLLDHLKRYNLPIGKEELNRISDLFDKVVYNKNIQLTNATKPQTDLQKISVMDLYNNGIKKFYQIYNIGIANYQNLEYYCSFLIDENTKMDINTNRDTHTAMMIVVDNQLYNLMFPNK